MSVLNAYLYPVEDISNNDTAIAKADMIRLTDFNYKSNYNRDKKGNVFKTLDNTIITVTFGNTKDRSAQFYKYLQSKESFNCKLFINALFASKVLSADNSPNLKILKFSGQVVDIIENYNYTISNKTITKYYTTTVQLLITKMIYVSKDGTIVRTLTVNQQ